MTKPAAKRNAATRASLTSVEAMSERARMLVARMLDEGAAPDSITRAVRKETNEHPTIQAVTNYARQYRAAQKHRSDARKCTSLLVEQIQKQGCEITDLLRAALMEAFTHIAENGKAQEIKLLDWDKAERQRRELALKERMTNLAERRVQAIEKRLKLETEKMNATLDKLDQKARQGRSLGPEDVRRIRAIYGLGEACEEELEGSEE